MTAVFSVLFPLYGEEGGGCISSNAQKLWCCLLPQDMVQGSQLSFKALTPPLPQASQKQYPLWLSINHRPAGRPTVLKLA